MVLQISDSNAVLKAEIIFAHNNEGTISELSEQHLSLKSEGPKDEELSEWNSTLNLEWPLGVVSKKICTFTIFGHIIEVL